MFYYCSIFYVYAPQCEHAIENLQLSSSIPAATAQIDANRIQDF